MNNELKTFAITTLGCKVNQYESQQIRQFLEKAGLIAARMTAEPNLVIVNTCCVTQTASAKSRQYINKARRLSPAAIIIIRGCLATAETGELDKDDGIFLIGHDKDLQTELLRIITGQKAASNIDTNETVSKPADDYKIKHKNKLLKESPLENYTGQTRAFLKIQDGCDGFCSYCIVPKLRTVLYSKPAHLVLQEAKNLINAGHKEIVLSGIFLGAYGHNTVRRSRWKANRTSPLAELLGQIVRIEGLARVRLSSLEPADVTDDLLKVFCNHKAIIAPHLHLPLQSGSEKVLKRMCRQYSASDYRRTLDKVNSFLDRPAVTTDIIVGFPGETEEDFQATLELANKSNFAKIHVFPFSPRKGTAAYEMRDKVTPAVIRERAQILGYLDKQLQDKFHRQFIGEPVSVIVENCSRKISQGRCERYFMVKLPGIAKYVPGTIHKTTLTEDSF